MKSLDLYKFVIENKIEYHWRGEDVIMFVPNYNLDEFADLLGWRYFDDNGLNCTMKHKYFCFWMLDILESFDIPVLEIFPNKSY
jgi:hypothetical protein